MEIQSEYYHLNAYIYIYIFKVIQWGLVRYPNIYIYICVAHVYRNWGCHIQLNLIDYQSINIELYLYDHT